MRRKAKGVEGSRKEKSLVWRLATIFSVSLEKTKGRPIGRKSQRQWKEDSSFGKAGRECASAHAATRNSE